MPKSKRDKKISLTRTTKKGLEFKQNLVDVIRSCVDQYARIFVFSAHHMQTNNLKDMRLEWSHSRFFLGKNKVMALALGRTPEEEVCENIHKVSSKLIGHCGLLFTNSTKDEVLEYFRKKRFPDYPHAGDVATETIQLKEGLLPQFSHSIEPHLRKLGLPTRLQRGIPELIKEHTVCKEGDLLTPEQASILKLLHKEMSEFYLEMEWCWNRLDGSFEQLSSSCEETSEGLQNMENQEGSRGDDDDDDEN
ncbi:mRNA turnover protein 4 homolog [Macrobrachium rosenbergii]|uniref:mRNA turnover protein 4 homolog n=1 Tax=Macrobrachium rosenbergii TaxID=79674 RepID=UPI0034D43DD5